VEIVDPDLLFQIPQEDATIVGWMERKQDFEVQQWSRERVRANVMVDLTSSRRKKTYV
jgi:hypothetical protein